MVEKSLRYKSRAQLDSILGALLSTHTKKVSRIVVDPGIVTVQLLEDIPLVFATNSVLDEVRAKELEEFAYEGEFTIDVLFAVYSKVRADCLIPGYLLVAPESDLYRTMYWSHGSFETVAGTYFLGTQVIEDPRLDVSSFVVVGCYGVVPETFTIAKGYRSTLNGQA